MGIIWLRNEINAINGRQEGLLDAEREILTKVISGMVSWRSRL